MARIGNRILLGYVEEPITDKYKDQVDYTTNKIGGKPDWPGDAPTAVTCKLCNLNLPLVIQIYAPLDYSPYHRTLYIFACINPNCWNQMGSWVCLRSQILADANSQLGKDDQISNDPGSIQNEWSVDGGDCWDDEENGNTVGTTMAAAITSGMGQLSVDERNANSGGSAEGAMGVVPMATATIEGDEGEVVCIDTPTSPQINLIAMLEEAAPVPQVPTSNLQFISSFISVGEEELSRRPISPTNAEHIRELMGDLQMNEEVMSGSTSPQIDEKYEKSLPAHGDKLFYQFISRVQANPGQILRYGGYPLLLYQMQDKPRNCRYCGAELLFELQLLPTLIPVLRLAGSDPSVKGSHVEFGSVFLFSCSASCWDQRDSYREEQLVMQIERI